MMKVLPVRQQLFNSLGLALLIIGISACSEPPPPLSPLNPNATILAFGDSLTHGTGVERSQSYPAVLQKKTGLKVINAGIPGEVSADGLKRLPELLEKHQPELLILCHGGNDLLRNHPKAKLRENLQAMIERAKAQGTEVILLGVPTPNPMNIKSPPLYGELAEEQQVPIEDDILEEVLSSRIYKSDNIHPNAEGYRMMAEAVYDLMVEAGAWQ